MQKVISRRRFLKQATLAGGAALLAGPAGAAKPSTHSSHAGTPRPYRPSRAEVAASFARQADYGEVTRQPVFKMHLEPHWFGDDSRFWYRNALAQGRREFLLVDAAQGVQ